MLIGMLAGIVFSVAIYLAVIWGAMWAANRFLSRWIAVAVGVLAVLYFAQDTMFGLMFCAAEPVFVDPSPEDAAAGSVGQMLANCDGPGGITDRIYLYFIAPCMLLSIGYFTVRFAQGREAQT